jgi:hypothetical protein
MAIICQLKGGRFSFTQLITFFAGVSIMLSFQSSL